MKLFATVLLVVALVCTVLFLAPAWSGKKLPESQSSDGSPLTVGAHPLYSGSGEVAIEGHALPSGTVEGPGEGSGEGQ